MTTLIESLIHPKMLYNKIKSHRTKRRKQMMQRKTMKRKMRKRKKMKSKLRRRKMVAKPER